MTTWNYTLRDDDNATDMMWAAGMGGAGPWVHCSCGKDHNITGQLPADLQSAGS
jgi:hypothetical protein